MRRRRDEILRHIQPGALKLVLYEGQPQPGAGGGGGRVVTAAQLAGADIVLTTYDVLRRDIHHCPDGATAARGLRYRKKYEARGREGAFGTALPVLPPACCAACLLCSLPVLRCSCAAQYSSGEGVAPRHHPSTSPLPALPTLLRLTSRLSPRR